MLEKTTYRNIGRTNMLVMTFLWIFIELSVKYVMSVPYRW